jgi:CoA:oxalate CoA-transferase
VSAAPAAGAPLLAGVRVLDLTRVLAGPYASMVLADLGAEVLKVELPGHGDESRQFGPFQNGESAYFTSINRGKKSITLDLRTSAGQDVACRLARASDVLMENFRPGTMASFGMDYQRLQPLHRRLVYASISGFGQSGPYAQRPAYDIIIQAMGGIASITGMPGGPPVRVGSSVGDLGASLFAVIGILAALGQARQTGHGQHLDLSMLDCQVALLENAVARYAVTGQVPGPLGSRHASITPFQFFPAADGHVVVAAGNDRLWAALCQVLGVGAAAADPRFATNALRTENHAALEPLLAARFRGHSVAHWCRALGAAGIPCGPINTVADLFDDAQVAARGMIARVEHPIAGVQQTAASPLRFSGVTPRPLRPAPLLGQHTDEVLEGLLGLGADERAALRREGVI